MGKIKEFWFLFNQGACYLTASALTYYTVLSLVPLLAVAFGIALLFDIDKELEREIVQSFAGQPELSQHLVNFAYSLLNQARGGIIAAIGSITLLWTTFTLLVTVEECSNRIWDVENPRRLGRQIVHYIGLILFGPFLLVLSTLVLAFLTAKFTMYGAYIGQLIPSVVVWSLFFGIYWYMPNCKIPPLAALSGALIAGTLFQLLHWAVVEFQIGITGYGAIYGSFAALPLFLIWIQLSWNIFLSGIVVAKQFASK